MKTDLRFERTEKNLHQALITLLREKTFSKISVTSLCQLARCSRNAFYQHYKTKEHILQANMDKVVAALEEICRPVTSNFMEITFEEAKHFTTNVLSAVDEHRDLVRLFLQQEQLNFTNELKHTIVKMNFRTLIDAKIEQNPVYSTFIIYYGSGLVGFIEYWLLETNYSVIEAIELFHQATYQSPFSK